MPYLPDSGFDFVAWFYDPLARLVYGRALQRAQQAALHEGLSPSYSSSPILIIGGGTGWVLGEVLGQRPQARVLYLEASPAMLARSQAWLSKTLPQHVEQVEFRLGTEAALRPDEQFETVITFFFLDLFEAGRLRQLVQQLHAALASGGTWLLADFAAPRRGWHRGLLWLMYCFFGLTTGIRARRRPPIEAELARLGLACTTAGDFFGQMITAQVWQQTPAAS